MLDSLVVESEPNHLRSNRCMINAHFLRKNTLAVFALLDLSNQPLRLWWNWQTRNLEVVVLSGVQVQVLLTAPFFFPKESIIPFPSKV